MFSNASSVLVGDKEVQSISLNGTVLYQRANAEPTITLLVSNSTGYDLYIDDTLVTPGTVDLVIGKTYNFKVDTVTITKTIERRYTIIDIQRGKSGFEIDIM